VDGINYKVLNERQVRASSGIMFLFGLIASINGIILQNYSVIPYISGFLLLSFAVAVFINPRYSPTMLIGYFFVRKQTPLYIGAVQKKFAWSLGLALATAIFVLSIFLLADASYFTPLCQLCIICLVLLYLETAFGICVGCKLYFLAIRMKLLKEPSEKPNCMGDACNV
jgi:cation transporter-like permease